MLLTSRSSSLFFKSSRWADAPDPLANSLLTNVITVAIVSRSDLAAPQTGATGAPAKPKRVKRPTRLGPNARSLAGARRNINACRNAGSTKVLRICRRSLINSVSFGFIGVPLRAGWRPKKTRSVSCQGFLIPLLTASWTICCSAWREVSGPAGGASRAGNDGDRASVTGAGVAGGGGDGASGVAGGVAGGAESGAGVSPSSNP